MCCWLTLVCYLHESQKQHIKNTKGGAVSAAPTPAPPASKKRPHSAGAAAGSDALGSEEVGDKRPRPLVSSQPTLPSLPLPSGPGGPTPNLSQAQVQQLLQQQMLQHLLALQQMQAAQGPGQPVLAATGALPPGFEPVDHPTANGAPPPPSAP